MNEVSLKPGIYMFKPKCDLMYSINFDFLDSGACIYLIFEGLSVPVYETGSISKCVRCLYKQHQNCDMCIKNWRPPLFIPISAQRNVYIYSNTYGIMTYRGSQSTTGFFNWINNGAFIPISYTRGLHIPGENIGSELAPPARTFAGLVFSLVVINRWRKLSPTARQNAAAIKIQRAVRRWAIRELKPGGRIFNKLQEKWNDYFLKYKFLEI